MNMVDRRMLFGRGRRMLAGVVGAALATWTVGVAGAGSEPEPEDGAMASSIEVSEPEVIADSVSLNLDVSPDGEWRAWPDRGDVCLARIDGSDQVCAEYPEPVGSINWSPDSSQVVVGPNPLRTLSGGPLALMTTNGATEILVEVDAGGDRADGPYDATIVDDTTIMYPEYSRAAGESGEIAWRQLDLVSSTVTDVLTGIPAIPTDGMAVTADAMYAEIFDLTATSEYPGGTYRIPFDGSGLEMFAATEQVERNGSTFSLRLAPMSAAGDHVVVGAIDQLGNFFGNSGRGPFLYVSDTTRDAPVAIEWPVADYEPRAAVLSGDGSLLAVTAGYVGADEAVRDSVRRTTLAVVDVASLMAGTPVWSTPVGVDGVVSRAVRHLPASFWTGESTIVAAGIDAVRSVEVTVEP